MILHVDNTDVLACTQALKKMHRSNFPITVKNTLNDLAYDVKKNTLLQSADKEFTRRNKTFFNKFSGFKKANGWDVNSMKSEVGIVPNGNKSAEELSLQEEGGSKTKPFIYTKHARLSKSNERLVTSRMYINKFEKITGTPTVANKYSRKSKYEARSRKSNIVAQAIMAKRLNRFVIWDSKSGQTVSLVNNISFRGKGRNRNVKINMTPVADYEKNRRINLHKKPFLKKASLNTYSKVNQYFVENAKKRLQIGRK